MIGTTLNQRFTLEKELGRGGMGAVYRATDQVLQRTVAIKILKDLGGEDVGKKLRLEAQILARLLHENIVRLYDFGFDQDIFFFIMEEVDGVSYQKRWKRVPLEDCVRVLRQVADALDYAHQQGVIHRDVKPANVLLTVTDQAKLSDFGLSVLSNAAQETGVVRGTPHYMSPEQAKGRRLDYRTDIYSLGIMLYESATGAPPYFGQTLSVMSQHVNAEPEPPVRRNPALSDDFNRLIMSMLAKRPEARPASGQEVSRILKSLLEERRLTKIEGGAAGIAVPVVVSGGTGAAAGAPPDQEAGVPTTDSGVPTPETQLTAPVPAGVSPEAVQPPTPALPSLPSIPAGRLAAAAAQDMLDRVLREPITITPDERYLCGHYLAYLLGGSRKRGFFGGRPLDPLNSDRARLLLAMAYLSQGEPSEKEIERAARLLEERTDVRGALNPIVVVKYLNGRDNPKNRKRFRTLRRQLQEASPYAAKYMTDENGLLNPGLMPQVIDDLKKLAPERTEVNDELVVRWNRVTEVWRGNPEFRKAVLSYATKRAAQDPASVYLWPEVVYPLIERARWQRRVRSRFEAVWDFLSSNLRVPDAGVRMDKAFQKAVPEQVVHNLDESLDAFAEVLSMEEPVDAEPASGAGAESAAAKARPERIQKFRAESFEDLQPVDEDQDQDLIRLAGPDPYRVPFGDLRKVWQEAIAALRSGGGKKANAIPVGPYRLAVIPSIRSRSAGTVALQGMVNKQIELLVPGFSSGGGASRIAVAVWIYQNQSAVVTYMDHLMQQKYILWDAFAVQQLNFNAPDELNHALFLRGMEVPDQLDRALTRHFRPQSNS